MPEILFKIAGSVNLHNKTHYKLEISISDGRAWTLYRRYSDFWNLYQSLVASFGEEKIEALELGFPDKTIGSTWKIVIDKRITQLTAFLNKILATDELKEHSQLPLFFDVQNKGISGVQIQFGESKIAKETFARTKNNKPFIFPWVTSFVVLLKSGELAVLNSIYDNTAKAEVIMKVSNCLIVPKANNNVVVLTDRSTNHKLQVSFSTPQESAFWIRALSDYSVSTTLGSEIKTNNEVQKRQSATAAKQQAQNRQQDNNATHHKAAGVGATTDELSAQFGI